MKLKNFRHLLFIISIICFYSCNEKTSNKKVDEYLDNAEYAKDHNVYTNAISYNDAIVGIQTKIITEVLEFAEYSEHLFKMRKQLAVVQEEIKIALTTANKIYYSGDTDQRFKKATLKLFNFYDRLFTEDYVAILDLRYITDNEEDYDIANAAYLEMNKIVEKFSAEEAIVDLEFEEAQKIFARENRMFIDPSAHPLQEEIDDL
tara:strand:- start:736 stop:1347 length:612 start_codon:yes stop_codon:yes gene_type:complete